MDPQQHRQPHALPCLPVDIAKSGQEIQVRLQLLYQKKQGSLPKARGRKIDHEDFLARARREKVEIHVGSLMVIVSVKHFERDPSEWTLKARIVFRSDAAKNQEGLSAVFDELFFNAVINCRAQSCDRTGTGARA